MKSKVPSHPKPFGATRRLSRALLEISVGALFAVNAFGQLQWDPTGGATGAQGGSGNWLSSNGGSPWWNGSANVGWIDGSSASFGGTAGVFVDSGGVIVDDITFNLITTLRLGGSSGSLTLGMGDGVHAINTNNTNATISIALAGTEGFVKSGSGTLTLNGVNSLGGPITISAGQLIVNGSNAINDTSTVTVASGTSLTVLGPSSETIGALSGSGSVSVLAGSILTAGENNGSTMFSGSLSGGGTFAKTGAGTLTFSGVSATPIMINGGTLAATDAFANTGTVTVGPTGTLQLLASSNIGTLVGSGTISLGSNSLSINTDGNFGGVITGTGALTMFGSGTLTLGGGQHLHGRRVYCGGTRRVDVDP